MTRLLLLLMFSVNVHALNMDSEGGTPEISDPRIWLPPYYFTLLPSLEANMQVVEAMRECSELIHATVHQDLTNAEQTIFKITCRNLHRRSFVVYMDGERKQAVDPSNPSQSFPLAEFLERQHILRSWKRCEPLIRRKIRNMRSLKWLTAEPTVKKTDDGVIERLFRDFDSEDVDGRPLHYRAQCDVDNNRYSVKIRARSRL